MYWGVFFLTPLAVVGCISAVSWWRQRKPSLLRHAMAVLGGLAGITGLLVLIAAMLPVLNQQSGHDLVVTCFFLAMFMVLACFMAFRTAFRTLMLRHQYLAEERERRARFYSEADRRELV